MPTVQEPGEKQRTAPTPRGGTGFGSGGGFGGGFGGGGSGFFGAPGQDTFSGSLGTMNQLRRKMVMGPNGPIMVTNSPLTADNVPIMASPGEMVMNNGVTQIPGMMELLAALNQLGVQHLAFGGMVRPQVGGFQRPGMGGGQMAPQASVNASGARPVGTPRPTAAPQAPAPPVANTGATGTGRPNPWGDAPLAPGSTNPGDEWMNRISELMKQFGQGGWFSPGGSPQLMAAVQKQALDTANAQNQQAMTQAKLMGLDPGQAGSYAAEAALRGQGNVADAMSNATLSQLLNSQQFGQGLLGQMYGNNAQAWLAQLAKWMQG